MAHTFKPYFIQCLTNMHVGSGDADYGVVDKLVQRDPVTEHPTIHSSSLKGALREHFESAWGKADQKVNTIFGKEVGNSGDSEAGSYKFLGADLVALPVRSNFQQYIMAINQRLVEDNNRKAEMLTGKAILETIEDISALYYKANEPGYEVYTEDVLLKEKKDHIQLLKGETTLDAFSQPFGAFNKKEFRSLSKNLAVIARNKLENGKSENLWYEEVVPHQSVFLTFIAVTDDYLSEFEQVLKNDVVQIGGNASIGYGLCKFHSIQLQNKS